MNIAGSLDLDQVVEGLRESRSIFHAEADFQHALAWQIHLADHQIQVRLETRAAHGERVDLLVARPDLGVSTAFELKYMSAATDVKVGDEHYVLPRHGAQDIRGYDVIRDIARLERFVAAGYASNGIMIARTNDPSYWRDPAHGRQTGASAFRRYEGVTLSGPRAWGGQSAGTAKLRPDPLILQGTYRLNWSDYSQLPDGGPMFRMLVVEVAPGRPLVSRT